MTLAPLIHSPAGIAREALPIRANGRGEAAGTVEAVRFANGDAGYVLPTVTLAPRQSGQSAHWQRPGQTSGVGTPQDGRCAGLVIAACTIERTMLASNARMPSSTGPTHARA
jgi:hypothetical protein